MGKKSKPKKVSVKRERYKKFRKDKGGSTFTTPDPTMDEMKEIKESEARLESFMRFRKPNAPRVINERKLKSKRDRV
ncbi:hypothetical protein J4418_02140 [Candidatus Woesearchaeota archaeon]|nr:hypothetical protein [Candidatus Woesearchaeota archaeon]